MKDGPWKDGKRWVYSITYDEGFAALLDHALPIHRRYGVPGHVCLVASQIGVERDVRGSTYNEMMILSAAQITELRTEGWGVSSHSMTHASITDANADREVRQSRGVLEHQLGTPIDIFCLPGDNHHHDTVRRHAPGAGYRAIMTIFDEVNPPDVDPLRLCRCPLHTRYPPPFSSVFDPYKRIHQAIDAGGWIIDYCHCPMPGEPIHPAKDCTSQELEERFATVLRIGGNDVWLADPGEVIAFMAGRP